MCLEQLIKPSCREGRGYKVLQGFGNDLNFPIYDVPGYLELDTWIESTSGWVQKFDWSLAKPNMIYPKGFHIFDDKEDAFLYLYPKNEAVWEVDFEDVVAQGYQFFKGYRALVYVAKRIKIRTACSQRTLSCVKSVQSN